MLRPATPSKNLRIVAKFQNVAHCVALQLHWNFTRLMLDFSRGLMQRPRELPFIHKFHHCKLGFGFFKCWSYNSPFGGWGAKFRWTKIIRATRGRLFENLKLTPPSFSSPFGTLVKIQNFLRPATPPVGYFNSNVYRRYRRKSSVYLTLRVSSTI